MPTVKVSDKKVEGSKPRQSGPEFKKVKTKNVFIDASNPRLGGGSLKATQESLQKVLMSEPHFANELVESFVKNGFIEYEPLVVRQEGETYIVIEGNRRLAAIKHILADPDKYPANIVEELKEIPVLVFHQKADSTHAKEIRTYLGVRHLLGYREWPAESKAMFLDQNIKSRADFKRLKSEFAMPRNDIARYLVPYRVKKTAKEILKSFQSVEDQTFWTLGEALQRAGIKEYIKLEVDNNSLKVLGFDKTKFRYLLEFLYGSSSNTPRGTKRSRGSRRITETRQLTRLAKVLANKRGSEKLEGGSSLEEAELYVSSREETIARLISDLRVTLKKIIAIKPTNSQTSEIIRHFNSFERSVKAL